MIVKAKLFESWRNFLNETDMGAIQQMGLVIGKELGKGKSGAVYAAVKGTEKVALKVVKKESFAYDKEKQNYSNIKKFIGKARDGGLEKWLPVVYDVQEHDDGVYIVLERLLPLSDQERRSWKGIIQATAEAYKLGKKQSDAYGLLDYIEDTGAPELDFNYQKARKIIDSLSKQPEFELLNQRPDYFAGFISSNKTKDTSAFKIFEGGTMMDDMMLQILLTLYAENSKFETFFNNLATILDKAYSVKTGKNISDDDYFVSMILEALYDDIFAQKNPMKYTDDSSDSSFQTGYGKSSSVYNVDVEPNPIKPYKGKKKGWVSRMLSGLFGSSKKKRPTPSNQERPYSGPNPAQNFKSTQEPEKYPFDPEIDAVNRLAQLFNIQSKDLHNANIMKRTDGHLVFVDVGLFDTTSMVTEGKKRKIIVKLT